jgi:hypothetical protein
MAKETRTTEEELVSVASSGSVDDVNSPEYRKMERRVLWKFDLHVLPPLALVSDYMHLLLAFYS